jgi:hypothetical protein
LSRATSSQVALVLVVQEEISDDLSMQAKKVLYVIDKYPFSLNQDLKKIGMLEYWQGPSVICQKCFEVSGGFLGFPGFKKPGNLKTYFGKLCSILFDHK